MTDHIRALSADLKAKLAVAVAAETRLIEAQQRAGVSAPQQIFTGSDVNAMRTEWYAEWLAMLPAAFSAGVANATGQRTGSPFAPRSSTADDIIRAGAKRRGENVVDLRRK